MTAGFGFLVYYPDRGYTVFNSGNIKVSNQSVYCRFHYMVVFLFSDTQMQGDGLVRDTVVLYTSDPSHTEIVIPVQWNTMIYPDNKCESLVSFRCSL
jgi:hypothetical protein